MTLAERNSGSKKLRDGERSHGLSRSVYTRLEYVFRQTPNLNFLDFILVEVYFWEKIPDIEMLL